MHPFVAPGAEHRVPVALHDLVDAATHALVDKAVEISPTSCAPHSMIWSMDPLTPAASERRRVERQRRQ